MAAKKSNLVFLLLIFALFLNLSSAQLSRHYYAGSCTSKKSSETPFEQKIKETFITIPATIRLYFHDCFVNGCDASVMIDSTSNNTAEKRSLRELNIGARWIRHGGGPRYEVELGRLDGLSSTAASVEGKLPHPADDINNLTSLFAKNGLSLNDMVALSGAHTVGVSHCRNLFYRLYKNSTEPIDPVYALKLKAQCPQNIDPSKFVFMDPETPSTFDNLYYKDLQNRKGLFVSDQMLYTDGRSKPTVTKFTSDGQAFNNAFATAMVKLGRVGVKTQD